MHYYIIIFSVYKCKPWCPGPASVSDNTSRLYYYVRVLIGKVHTLSMPVYTRPTSAHTLYTNMYHAYYTSVVSVILQPFQN